MDGNATMHGGDPQAAMRASWESVTYTFLAAQDWDPAGATLLLAVSGGADSVALLHFWARAAGPHYGCRLAAAHVNHGLRSGSAEDEAFVTALCRELGVPLFRCALDPRARPARESTEMWARRERYRFFAAAAREAGAQWIATAHQRDDLVETVFQRLGRGTGPRGLAGILFRRAPGIVRPFLNRSRSEILAYLESCGAYWREDESNADVRIDRNWYRHRYLPRLRLSEPDLDARVFALAMNVQTVRGNGGGNRDRSDEGSGDGLDALEAEAGLLTRDERHRPRLSPGSIAPLVRNGDRESLAYWLRALIRQSFPDRPARSVTSEILDEFCRQWERSPASLQVPVSRGIAVKSGNNGIYCRETVSEAASRASSAKKSCSREIQRVILDGVVGAASWQWENRIYTLSARRYPRPAGLVYPTSSEARAIFDADLFSCTLHIRTRQDGDCFSPLGVRSRFRKLKVFFNEKKVPIGMRDELPIVLSNETLAWVPGYGISEFLKVTDTSSSILELVLTCENL